MSTEGISRTVLATGLAKHAMKFIDPDANALPAGAPEADYFILDAALQKGFEMIDDDGDVYVCSSRQIVGLVGPYRGTVEELRKSIETRAPNDAQILAAARSINKIQAEACGVDADDQWKVYGNSFIIDAGTILRAALGAKP